MKRNVIYFFLITLFLVQCNNLQENTSIKLSKSDGFVSVNDSIKLYYEFIGSGKDTIVFLHGGPGFTSYYLRQDLLPLAFQNTLLFYDQRGAGKSTAIKDTSLVDASHYPDDLEALRKYFKLNKMTIVGHSWGGILAGLYAAKYPDKVEKMVVIGSVPPVKIPEWKNFGPNLYANIDVDKVRQKWEDLVTRKDTIKACWDYWSYFINAYYSNQTLSRRMWGDVCNCPSSNSSLNRMGWNVTMKSLGEWDLSESLKSFNSPVLIIQGENDPIPFESAKSWHNVLPNSQLSVFKGAGHFPQIEKPEFFFYQVNQFFKGKWPVDTVYNAGEADRPINGGQWGIYNASLELKSSNKKFMEYIDKQDAGSLSKLYTKDALVMAPTGPPVHGNLAIKAFWQAAMDKGLSKAELQTMDLEGDKEQLNEIGKYTLYDKDNNILDIGKYLIIWKKENGKWLMSNDMFNTNMKVPSKLYEWEPEYLF